jgi:lipopolysaccharide cholinephosphotransferase
MWLTIILCVMIMILLWVNYNNKPLNYKRQNFIHMTLKTMCTDLIQVLNYFNIPYFIHSGTLLGAVREQNIIFHDDDMDIAIFPAHKDIILSQEFNDELKKYNIHADFTVKKKVDKEIIIVKCADCDHSIFIDIFVFEEKDGLVQYKSPLCRQIWKRGYFKTEELYPLKEYNIDGLKLMGPNNPYPYLVRHYGKKWKIPYRRKRNHDDDINLSRTCNGKCI